MQQTRGDAVPDTSPLAVLYQQHAPALLAYVLRQVFSREDAEDIVLEAFLAALERNALAGLAEGEQQAWLWRVARNKLVDYQRRALRRPMVRLGEMEEALSDEELAPEQIALRDEEYAALRAHLADLPALQQEVLRLRFSLGLRCSEIAQRLHKREGAVRMLLSRTLNLLRDMYARQQEGDAHDE